MKAKIAHGIRMRIAMSADLAGVSVARRILHMKDASPQDRDAKTRSTSHSAALSRTAT
ncbi:MULTISPECIES: hypothetical protein [unclassified Lysobacter]|uniref:hypothetical protein n=1 Tax=unclassified Lysobacter TaxID=2635362 RepID=UPI000ACB73AD|nr:MULTISPECIES: hypothetical protein [unclassified Lysobacter]